MTPADETINTSAPAVTPAQQDIAQQRSTMTSNASMISKRIKAAEQWKADNVRNNLLFPRDYGL